jgi:glucosamine-phosphate N-acetyltransferase
MIQIRPCGDQDFEGVLVLLQQLWPDKPLDSVSLRSVYDRALTSDAQSYLCAVDVENVVGFGSMTIKNSLWQGGGLGHVDELIVDVSYRGHGIGTQLLEHLIDLARAKGCQRVELDSAFHRTQAHQFYEQHGFENRAYLFSKTL